MYLFISQLILISAPVSGFHTAHSSQVSLSLILRSAFLCVSKNKIILREEEKPTGGRSLECKMMFANSLTALQPFVCLCLDSELFRGGAPFLCLYKCLADCSPDRAGFLRGYRNAQ